MVGGGKWVTQIVNMFVALPAESVMLTEPSSVAEGVPEKAKLENDSQGGSETGVTL